MAEKVIVKEQVRNVKISSPGPQGPRGKTILNGHGNPSNNFGLEGDYYYDIDQFWFWGPKPSDTTWQDAIKIKLTNATGNFSWELSQLEGPTDGVYSITIDHYLGYHPNITVKDSAGDIWETGIEWNSENTITLTMAQPFSGTAYLS
jgi:hypothetical protein